MNTYKSDRPCAKCGHVGTDDTYRRAGVRWEGAVGVDDPSVPETIERECLNCGFEWSERVKPLGEASPHQYGYGASPVFGTGVSWGLQFQSGAFSGEFSPSDPQEPIETITLSKKVFIKTPKKVYLLTPTERGKLRVDGVADV